MSTHRKLAAVWLCFFALPLAIFGQNTGDQKNHRSARIDSIYSQGMLALRRGDLVSARVAFEKAVRLAPRSPEAHNSLGWVLLAQGQLEPAIPHFQTALQLKPDFPQAHINLSNALVQKGDLEGALREDRKSTRLNSSHGSISYAVFCLKK